MTDSHREATMRFPGLGIHCLLEMYDCATDRLDDSAFVERAIRDAAVHGQTVLLQTFARKFVPHGVTAVGLLAESHLTIHTWPEKGYAAVDVFTCGTEAKPDLACEFLINAFQPADYLLHRIARG